MLSKPVRIALFVLGAFAILGLTAGATQAANQLLGGVANARNGTAREHSLKAQASATLGASLVNTTSGDLEKAESTPVEKIEFSGVITAVEMGLITIGNFQVQVTADTEVKGDLVVGETVEVEAFLQENGIYLAHEIERMSDAVDDSHDESMDDGDDDDSDDQSDSWDDDDDHGDDDGDDDDHDDDDDDEGEGDDSHEGGGEHDRKP